MIKVYWLARSFPNKIRFWNINYWTLISSYRETKGMWATKKYVWWYPEMFSIRKQMFLEIKAGINAHQSTECQYKGQFMIA